MTQTTQVPEKIHNLNKTEGYPDGGPTVEIKGDGKYMTATPQTTLGSATDRAILAGKIAKSLMNFPHVPPPGTPGHEYNDFYKCLETSYTFEITKQLNEAANAQNGI